MLVLQSIAFIGVIAGLLYLSYKTSPEIASKKSLKSINEKMDSYQNQSVQLELIYKKLDSIDKHLQLLTGKADTT